MAASAGARAGSTRRKSGWLTKEGGSWKSWKRRFFLLEDGKLSYFKRESDKVPKGSINLESSGHIRGVEYRGKKYIFQIQTPSRTYFMQADSAQERDNWVEALNGALVEMHPAVLQPAVGVQDFELLKLVGKGSFGKVMQVRFKQTGEIFAMKVLSKQHIVEHNEIEHTMSELHILQKLHHPFLVNLHYSFQTEDKLYFILDFINGGELFFHLQREKKFSLERVRFYGAEICLALEHLHNAGVIYRDLKPENLLLTNEGHVVMTDFGLCKEGLTRADDKTDTFCGTPEYLAPEVLQGNGYGKAVDWWSYGSLLYEMLTGLPPFYSQDVQEMYRKIISETLTFPAFVTEEARSLLSQLLERDPEKRLADPNLIKRHPFFAGIDWEELFQKKIRPPFTPAVSGSADTSQIDPSFTAEVPSYNIPGAPSGPITPADQQEFAGFTFVASQQQPPQQTIPPPEILPPSAEHPQVDIPPPPMP